MEIPNSVIKIYQDYFDSLKKKRNIIKGAKKIGEIWVVGEIKETEGKKNRRGDAESDSNATITKTISRINELLENRVKVIEIHICSGGGDVGASFAIYDYLRKTNLPITTIAYGEVCSMAATLFEIGTIRKMTASSSLMIHHIQCGVDGTPEKIEREAQSSKYYDKLCFALFSIRSGIPLKKLERISHPLIYFNAEEAVKLNLADEII